MLRQTVGQCKVMLLRGAEMKVGIVGAGQVGSACLLSLVMRGCADEIVLINRDQKKARGVVTDVRYGAALLPRVDVRDGDYADLAGAAVVMITAGVNEKAGGATDRSDPLGRLRLLQANTAVFQEIVPKIRKAAPETLILVVTDPPDALADVVRMLGHERVLSTGTSLDTLRFSYHLGQRLKVRATDVDALVLGEHGTSSVFLWSSARVCGRKVLDLLGENSAVTDKIREDVEREVRYANITIIEGIGASQYGIGMVCAWLTEMVLRDERAVIPIGCYNAKFGVTLSLPSVVGRQGVERIIEPEMSDSEQQVLQRSAEAIQTALSHLNFSSNRARA
jgi:L-lactate dehydrogenase